MTDIKQVLDVIDGAIFQALTNIHSTVICKITKVETKTIDCQPVIARMNGSEPVTIQSFTKVPPVFMSGGASYTAHPVTAGDYCLLIISERCYDNWYFGGDFLAPLEFRMHDYSDGFALVGIKNDSGSITIPDVITQMGDTFQGGDYVHEGDMLQTGNTVINGNLTVNGDITCTGRVTCANATIAGIDFATHVHGGVAPGSGSTGVPQ